MRVLVLLAAILAFQPQTRQFLTTFTVTAVPQSSDFQTRCSTAVRCVGFDQASDISGGYGSNTGIFPGATTPTLDTTIKASGNSSLKMTVPANAPADTSGSYFANFSSDLQTLFGAGQEFFIQWRQRFSPEFLSFSAGQGWKQAIIGTGDIPGGPFRSSCTPLEVVTQNTYNRKFPQMYNSCTGSTSHGAFNPFEQPFGGDFKLQNARPSPFCLYSQVSSGTQFPPTGNCFGYFPNEWMTFQVGVTLGPRVNDEFTNSYVRLWVAREGQPSQLVMDWGPYNLSAGPLSENQKFGKVWLLVYNTGRSSTTTYPAGFTWYDELMISRTKIADPGGATAPPPPPGDTTLPAVTLSTTTPSNSNRQGFSVAVSDNVGVTSLILKVDGAEVDKATANVGKLPNTVQVQWQLNDLPKGMHSATARACDAAGNCKDSNPISFSK